MWGCSACGDHHDNQQRLAACRGALSETSVLVALPWKSRLYISHTHAHSKYTESLLHVLTCVWPPVFSPLPGPVVWVLIPLLIYLLSCLCEQTVDVIKAGAVPRLVSGKQLVPNSSLLSECTNKLLTLCGAYWGYNGEAVFELAWKGVWDFSKRRRSDGA